MHQDEIVLTVFYLMGVAFALAILFYRARKLVCNECGALDRTRTRKKGSTLIAILLLLIGFIAPVAWIVAVIYLLWMTSNPQTECTDCGSLRLIPWRPLN